MWKALHSWFSRLLPSGGRGTASRPRPRPLLRARYDAAQTTNNNTRHWSNADSLSPASANTLAVRQVLRDRSRYEAANNGYAAGIIRSRADDLVGVGPALQVRTPDEDVNDAVEKKFADWMWACGLGEKLHTMDMAESQDGESFALLTTNDKLKDPVKLDVTPIECDLVTDPTFSGWLNENIDDGVTYDAAGNPVSYKILKYHPGDQWRGMAQVEYDVWRAEFVLHSYRCDRPGQLRGVPELTSSLPLFAYLRRWTLATLSAAETAASFAAVLQTPAPADVETDEPVPFDTFEIELGMLTTLPEGTTMSQFAAEHPNTAYSDFKRELMNECGRPVQMPTNIALGDSSRHNFSSAKLDHFGYRAGIRVRRRIRERNILDRIFLAWLTEARLIPGHIPPVEDDELEWAWTWPGWASMDKDQASLDTERLNNGTATLAELSAEEGVDWRERVRQRAKELKLMAKEGVPPPPGSTPAAPPMGGGGGGAAPPFGGAPAPKPKPEPDAEEEAPAQANGHAARNRLRGAFCPTGEGGGIDPSCPAGGGGDGSGGDAPPRDMSDRWDREDAERHASWERDDENVQRERDREDENHAREEWELDRQEEESEKEWEKEDKQLERDDNREDRAFDKKWDKEEREIEKARDREAAKFEKTIKDLPPEEQERRWDEYRRSREDAENKEDQEFADRKETEAREIDRRREERDSQIAERRRQDEADVSRRRESLERRQAETRRRRDEEDRLAEQTRRELTEAEEKRRNEEYEKYRRERPNARARRGELANYPGNRLRSGFCPTGPGGGVDNSCSSREGGGPESDRSGTRERERELHETHKREVREVREARKADNKAIREARKAEDRFLEERRVEENREVNRQRREEDTQIERRRAEEDRGGRDRERDRRRDKEDRERQAARDREDDRRDNERDRENRERQAERDREDDRSDDRWDKEEAERSRAFDEAMDELERTGRHAKSSAPRPQLNGNGSPH